MTEEDYKGTVTITLFKNKPPRAKFEGDIRGTDISVALRGVMKEYRKWKHSQINTQASK